MAAVNSHGTSAKAVAIDDTVETENSESRCEFHPVVNATLLGQ